MRFIFLQLNTGSLQIDHQLLAVLNLCELINVHVQMMITCIFFSVEGDDFQLINLVIDKTQQITFTNCDQTKNLTIDIVDDTKLENNETIAITLTNVILTQMENRSNRIDLSKEEGRRLILNMPEITVTILDDDGTLLLILYTLLIRQ